MLSGVAVMRVCRLLAVPGCVATLTVTRRGGARAVISLPPLALVGHGHRHIGARPRRTRGCVGVPHGGHGQELCPTSRPFSHVFGGWDPVDYPISPRSHRGLAGVQRQVRVHEADTATCQCVGLVLAFPTCVN